MADKLLDSLDEIYESRPHLRPEVVLISGVEEAAPPPKKASDSSWAVGEWLRSGRIADVLPKGVAWRFFQAVLSEKLDRLWQRRQLQTVLADAADAFASLKVYGIITRDPKMTHVWRRLRQAAQSGFHTFICGEIGVGKEGVARAIARIRNRGIYIRNCGGQSDQLFASEIFGTVPGAYTGALDKPGWIEEAGDGVLFLNEFCSMPLGCQRALLRLLESDTREYSRLGDTRTRRAKCMFVFDDNLHPLEALREPDRKTAAARAR